MLVISRKLGEKVWIGENICIMVVDIDRGKIRLGIECPRDVPIYREEVRPEPLPPPEAPRVVECPACKGRGGLLYEPGLLSAVCDTCSGKGVIAAVQPPPASGRGREGEPC
jgi:carbon storage regulator